MRFLSASLVGLVVSLPALAGDDPKLTFVDIQPLGNHNLADDIGNYPGNHLKKVPQGEQEMEGSRFRIGEKLIELRAQRNPERPEKAEGLKVGATFDKLHILHSAEFGEGQDEEEDGTEVGAYIVHYDDKTEERIPIVYGED